MYNKVCIAIVFVYLNSLGQEHILKSTIYNISRNFCARTFIAKIWVFLRHLWSGNYFKDTVVNQTCHSTQAESLEISSTRQHKIMLNLNFRFSFNRVMPVVGALLTIVLAITVPVSWISFPGFVALLWLAYFFAFMHFSTIPTQVM